MANVPVIQWADEPEAIGKILIAKSHPHLATARIVYVFTNQTRRKCDRVRLGSAAKMSHIQRFLASAYQSVESGPDFILIFDANIWPQLTDKQQQALTEHEICHCCVYVKSGLTWRRLLNDENKGDYSEWKYGLRGHTIEEFYEVVEKYGFWREDDQEEQFVKAAKQLQLPGLAVMAQSRN